MSQKHIVIGTAGHVDHGKTTLTRALIGSSHQLIDRLKEEKKRGITITLGFAQLNLPNGESASIIDVPGHEKLIKNMLMGAAGIDLVKLPLCGLGGHLPLGENTVCALCYSFHICGSEEGLAGGGLVDLICQGKTG